MYLKKLYRHSKIACIILVAGCIVQLVIFYKQGAVATPFLNYGMYSEKISPREDYVVYKIYTDGKLLEGNDFSIQDWDKLYLPLYMYLSKDTVNNEMVLVQNRLLSKLHAPLIAADNTLFTNRDFDDAEFLQWYRNYVASVVNENIQQILIVKQQYTWNKKYLHPADSIMLFQ